MDWYQWQAGDLILSCHLQPKASRDEFAGLHGDSIKIRITAPPIEGRANAHLKKFLGKQFGVAKSHISIISGELGRQKRVKIDKPAKIPPILEIETP
ncbi:DUF167 domain-containing protein [Marinobacterium jannaschii]|uniref:DUF167 domain-containing protein n=1 Tax=Marinobacterium jannaschii TaxID=64970 RepID=UPI000489620C|nr:DUF167 domain-containing protein [Marinobacterium jannaschii]